MTPADTRYCVNSISMVFVPRTGWQRALLAGGCFWGLEYHLGRIRGVLMTRSGYCGGEREQPTYEDVCRGDTGHAETVEVWFWPEILSYRSLLEGFFSLHDPTQLNRQGPDVGEQYRSEIFALDGEQQKVALEVLDALRHRGIGVVTRLSPAGMFWPAEARHQQYYRRRGERPRCPAGQVPRPVNGG